MNIRKERVAEALARHAAEFLAEEANPFPLITVMGCDLSDNFQHATIRVTILPEDKEEQTLSYLRRKRTPMREYIKKKMRSIRVPSIEIVIDYGEKNRQKIDELV